MGRAINTDSNTHTYRPKGWRLVLNVFSLGFTGMVFGIPLVIIALMLISITRTESNPGIFMTSLACIFVPIALLLGSCLVLVTFDVIVSFFSYIKISSVGIEQKHFPYKHIRCDWADIDKLDKYLLLTDVIYLNSFKVVGVSLSLKSPFRLLRPKQGFISPTGYRGWPDGQLADDLKQYAPKLFNDQPALQVEVSENDQEIPPVLQEEESENNQVIQPLEDLSLSSEERMVAVLSHVSILFTQVGLIFPLVIYLIQKKKKSYVGFQALQAFLWQVGMLVFNTLASLYIMGIFFLPVFLSEVFPDFQIRWFTGGDMVLVTLISVAALIFGNLVFTVYGVIGAVQTYRGRLFRYAILGGLIEKIL